LSLEGEKIKEFVVKLDVIGIVFVELKDDII